MPHGLGRGRGRGNDAEGGGSAPVINLGINLPLNVKLLATIPVPSSGAPGSVFYVMGYFKRTGVKPDTYAIVCELTGATPYAQMYLRPGPGDGGAISLDTGETNDENYGGVLPETWTHVCLAIPLGGTDTRLYIDAVLVASGAISGLDDTCNQLSLGCQVDNRFVGSVTSVKYGLIEAGYLSLGAIASEMTSRTPINSNLTARSLNGHTDLSIFSTVGAGVISSVAGPDALS